MDSIASAAVPGADTQAVHYDLDVQLGSAGGKPDFLRACRHAIAFGR